MAVCVSTVFQRATIYIYIFHQGMHLQYPWEGLFEFLLPPFLSSPQKEPPWAEKRVGTARWLPSGSGWSLAPEDVGSCGVMERPKAVGTGTGTQGRVSRLCTESCFNQRHKKLRQVGAHFSCTNNLALCPPTSVRHVETLGGGLPPPLRAKKTFLRQPPHL